MSLKTFALSALFTVSAAAAQAADLAPPRLRPPGKLPSHTPGAPS
jgi:hypothetical protein